MSFHPGVDTQVLAVIEAYVSFELMELPNIENGQLLVSIPMLLGNSSEGPQSARFPQFERDDIKWTFWPK